MQQKTTANMEWKPRVYQLRKAQDGYTRSWSGSWEHFLRKLWYRLKLRVVEVGLRIWKWGEKHFERYQGAGRGRREWTPLFLLSQMALGLGWRWSWKWWPWGFFDLRVSLKLSRLLHPCQVFLEQHRCLGSPGSRNLHISELSHFIHFCPLPHSSHLGTQHSILLWMHPIYSSPWCLF